MGQLPEKLGRFQLRCPELKEFGWNAAREAPIKTGKLRQDGCEWSETAEREVSGSELDQAIWFILPFGILYQLRCTPVSHWVYLQGGVHIIISYVAT